MSLPSGSSSKYDCSGSSLNLPEAKHLTSPLSEFPSPGNYWSPRFATFTSATDRNREKEREREEQKTSTAPSIGSKTTASIRSTKSYIRPYFRSRRVEKGAIEKLWMKDKRSKLPTIIPCIGLLCGLGLVAMEVIFGLMKIPKHRYCLIMEDEFEGSTLNSEIWNTEVQLGGFGNGEFEITTNSGENVYLNNGKLVIKPTLQDTELLETDFAVLNLTADGTCTSSVWYNCWAATNSTNHTIINPIKSGRINTKGSVAIQYGRVEVRAKMPVGDWLWPAIWLLPENDTYGAWPASGEIDIAESRGNDLAYTYGGNNKILSSLHWGPTKHLDAYWRDSAYNRILHTTYTHDFHTFGLEWSEKYMYTYVDNRLRTVVYTQYSQSQWERGQFPQVDKSGDKISNPWDTGRMNTPFDMPFYLIINLAVGGTNGFFPDPDANKPWDNNAGNASKYFWEARNKWYPSWTEGNAQLEVDSVRMWKECD